MRGLALDNRVDNGPGGTCLVRRPDSAPGRSFPEPARVPVAKDAMSLEGNGMGAPQGEATGGVLCRPPTATRQHYMTNRGVSDPPTSAAGPFGARPRRVAHAPIPCPARAAVLAQLASDSVSIAAAHLARPRMLAQSPHAWP